MIRGDSSTQHVLTEVSANQLFSEHEHDPDEIIQSVEKCIEGAIKSFEKDGHSRESIKAVGITNQRETTVCWDIKSGEPLYNAIVWTDTRAAALARELKSKQGDKDVLNITGIPISTYPSVTKLLWMLKNVDKVKQAYDAGNLAFGTIDAWLVYKLNGGPENNVFVSDCTNSSRTMFMDIRTLKYSEEMLDFFSYEFDLRKVHMPEIVRSASIEKFGKLASGPLKGWPITGVLGDQSAALVGQKGYEPGAAKNTYGTGCFLLETVGEKPVISTHGLLATIAYQFDDRPIYALEGSIAVAGSGVKFLMSKSARWSSGRAAQATDKAQTTLGSASSRIRSRSWQRRSKTTEVWCSSRLSAVCLRHIGLTMPMAPCVSSILPAVEAPQPNKGSRHNTPYRARPHRASNA